MRRALWLLVTLLSCTVPSVGAASSPGADGGDGGLNPTPLGPRLHGMFQYQADAARFRECLTGRDYPVAMEGAYLDLERAYLQAEPGRGSARPLLAAIEGEIAPRPPMEGDGPVPTVLVHRLIGLFPGQRCEQAMTSASLVNTYWRLVTLHGRPVPTPPGEREAHLVLHQDPRRYAATAGCNRIMGAYEVAANRLSLQPGATTRMACPPPLDTRERELLHALSETRGWSVTGPVLELTDATGAPLATFEAVYLP